MNEINLCIANYPKESNQIDFPVINRIKLHFFGRNKNQESSENLSLAVQLLSVNCKNICEKLHCKLQLQSVSE